MIEGRISLPAIILPICFPANRPDPLRLCIFAGDLPTESFCSQSLCHRIQFLAIDNAGHTNFTSAMVTVCYSNGSTTNCFTIPLGVWEGYFISNRVSYTEVGGGLPLMHFSVTHGSSCGGVLNRWTANPALKHSFLYNFSIDTLSESQWLMDYFPASQCVPIVTPALPSVEDLAWNPAWTCPPVPSFVCYPPGQSMAQPTGRSRGFGFQEDRTYQGEDSDLDGEPETETVDTDWVDHRGGTNVIQFMAPIYYGTNTPVIFTFEGVDYARTNDLDLTLVKFKDPNSGTYLDPVTTNNANGHVGYLITVDGGRHYTINSDSFQRPGSKKHRGRRRSTGVVFSQFTNRLNDWGTRTPAEPFGAESFCP